MNISTRIRYGIRAMVELAGSYGKGPLGIREIAQRQSISVKYLEQTLRSLSVTVKFWLFTQPALLNTISVFQLAASTSMI